MASHIKETYSNVETAITFFNGSFFSFEIFKVQFP